MSWAGLSNNQTISFNNLQNAVNTGVFLIRTAIPASTEQITRLDAETYVNINSSFAPFAAKGLNQLVVKSNLIRGSQGFLGFSSSGPRSLTCIIGTRNLSIGTLTASSQSCSTPSQVSIFNQPNSTTATLLFIFGASSFSEEYQGPVRVYNMQTGALVFSDFIDVETPTGGGGMEFSITLTGLAGGVSFYYEILINGKDCPSFPDPNIQ